MQKKIVTTNSISLRACYIAAIITFFIFLIYRVALIFYVQPDVGGVEVNVIYFIQQLLDGRQVYQDPEQVPYSIAQYSPFYYYLVAGIARLTGISADDILSLFALSRTISLVLNFFFALVVFRMGKNIFRLSGSINVLIGILSFIFLQVTSFSRPDSLSQLFFMLAVYVFMLGVKREEVVGKAAGKFIFFSAVISAVALFSKQNAIVLPVIFGAWLLVRKQYRLAILFGFFYVLASGLFLAIMYAAGEIPFFFKNVIQGVNNGISASWYYMVILQNYYYGFGMFFLLLFIVLFFLLKKESQLIFRFSLFALVLLFILQNLMALKNGSNPGYFTEWWTLLIVLAAVYLSTYITPGKLADLRLPAALICFLLVMKVALLAQPLYRMIKERPFAKAYSEYNEEKAVADYLLQQPGPREKLKVFPNYYTAGSFMSVLLFRYMVMPQMDIVILASYPNKGFDYSNFTTGLMGGRFPWMIMYKTDQQKQFYENRLEKFQLKATGHVYNIYQYNP